MFSVSGCVRGAAAGLVKNGIISEEDKDVYAYGLELLASAFTNAVTIMAVMLVTGCFVPVLVFVLAFAVLRKNAGGYHAKTHLGCNLFLAAVLLTFIYLESLEAACKASVFWTLAELVCAVPLSMFAPVSHPNKRIREKDRGRLKRNSCVILTLLIFASALCVPGKDGRIACWTGAAVLSVTALMIAQLCINLHHSPTWDVT